MRGKSVGETVDLIVTCQDDGETTVPLTIGLSDIKLHIPDGHDDTIDIGGGISIKMKYPSMMDISKYQISKTNTVDLTFGIIKDCLESIFDEEQVYEEMTKKELDEFIESMSTDQFGKLQKFFDTMPRVKHTIKVTNPKTNVESDVTIEGLKNFLG